MSEPMFSPSLDAVLAALEGHAGTLTFNEGQRVRDLIAELRVLALSHPRDARLATFVDEWADKPGFAQLAALLLKTAMQTRPDPILPQPVVVAIARRSGPHE
jgi:hypothetical protein